MLVKRIELQLKNGIDNYKEKDKEMNIDQNQCWRAGAGSRGSETFYSEPEPGAGDLRLFTRSQSRSQQKNYRVPEPLNLI